MKCDGCGTNITEDENHEHNNKKLCEDCYMDALSPAKFCDPWASYSAESFARNNKENPLTDHQKKIMQVLKKTGGVAPFELAAKLEGHMSAEDGERACAALHRMGKISIESKDGSALISLK